MGLVLAMMTIGVIGPLLMGDPDDPAPMGSTVLMAVPQAPRCRAVAAPICCWRRPEMTRYPAVMGPILIFADDGDDVITGGADAVVILPGPGQDIVDAGPGDYLIEAADLVDDARLDASMDSARSFAVIEIISAFDAEADAGGSIDAGAGNDAIVAGSDDTSTGGDGADEIATGDWGQTGAPVEITDFNPKADLLTYTSRAGTPAPTLSTHADPDSGVVTVLACGHQIRVLRNLPGGPDPNRITV